MTGNLFEQQARIGATTNIFEQQARLDATLAFIKSASLEQRVMIMRVLRNSLWIDADRSTGMKEANLREASEYADNVMTDIQCAIVAPNAHVCNCGKCDACVAARSDEHHDRKRDGEQL